MRGLRERSTQGDLLLTLMILGRFGMMPELLDFLGGDSQELLRFIDQFGGMTLDVPSREQVAAMARDTHIWRTMKDLTPDDPRWNEQANALATMYGLTERRIRAIRQETMEEVERLDGLSG